VPAVAAPLVVDLDGTLLKSDSLHESLALLFSRNPRQALDALLALRQGRASFKAAVADNVMPDAMTTPVDETVAAAVKEARSEGRKVYLATAADRRIAELYADAMGPFDGVFASENGVNLKGDAKAACLTAAFGWRGFDYVGNAKDDVPVWRAARTPIVARADTHLVAALVAERPDAVVLSASDRNAWSYLRALRPHQWTKNVLIALPAIASHRFDLASFVTLLIAFASFSLGASSVYLVNDMLDLPHDRIHPEKRHRPFASGVLSLQQGVILLSMAAALSLALALLLPWQVLVALSGYIGLSLSYAFYLKRNLMIDVVALAALYGVRVLTGNAAVGVIASQWLLAFCFFLFLSLALMKRTAEILALPETEAGKISGRSYRRADLPVISSLTAASGFGAVLVLTLYINSSDVRLLYRRPDVLWGICVVLLYWLGRACLMTGRGEMRQDPVIFAATDAVTWKAGMLVAAIFLIAL
jgi:4-hydroxybenzoate polyprenyltransferase